MSSSYFQVNDRRLGWSERGLIAPFSSDAPGRSAVVRVNVIKPVLATCGRRKCLPEVSHVSLTHRARPRSSGNSSTDQPRRSSASISRRTRSRTVWGTGTRRSRSDGVPSHDDSGSAPLGGLLGYRAFCVWDSERGSVMKHEGRQGGGCTCVFRGRRCPLLRRAEQLARTAGQQGQTRRPDQVVVADGRSTDGTREWSEQFSGTGLRVVDNPQLRVSAALNRAVEVADGDVVARWTPIRHTPRATSRRL